MTAVLAVTLDLGQVRDHNGRTKLADKTRSPLSGLAHALQT